jgi:4,5-DOPA dioxygenase extradiol
MNMADQMPAVFFGHGSPMNALAQNHYTQTWRRLGESVPRPKAILAISAHWCTPGTAVTAMENPRTIHDFGGFPQALFDLQYPAPGSPLVAARVRDVLAPVGVRLDEEWGLDHGTWSVLVHAFPKADIPIVQLSIDATKPPAFHYDLGSRLAPLRAEGVLIIGSGNVVHNLRRIRWEEDAPAYDWAVRFNAQVRDHLMRRDHQPLVTYEQMGDDARLSVPTSEHFLPLLYILGLQGDQDSIAFPLDGIQNSSIGMLTLVVGADSKPR